MLDAPMERPLMENPKSTDGLRLFEDLNEQLISFSVFLDKFRELPRAEQDRLLAPGPKLSKVRAASD